VDFSLFPVAPSTLDFESSCRDLLDFGLSGTRFFNIPMSTTSHKSRTRILSEAAMKSRVHTSQADRDLTWDGLSIHHNEGAVLKVKARSGEVKCRATAAAAKRTQTNQLG